MHLFSPLGSCALVLTTGSCCALVRAPWFMSTCSNHCFMCTCCHYWFMLYTCSRPLVHVHLFSLLVHVVHLFSPLGSCARSHYWFMFYTCSRPLVHVHLFSLLVLIQGARTSVQHEPVVRTSAHEPRGEKKCTTWTSSENKCTWTKGREQVYNMNQ
jgi:hypothetical protein